MFVEVWRDRRRGHQTVHGDGRWWAEGEKWGTGPAVTPADPVPAKDDSMDALTERRKLMEMMMNRQEEKERREGR